MRIGYDGKRAAKNLTGLGNYSRWLIAQLAVKYPENEYLVYAPAVKKSPRIEKFFSLDRIFLKLNIQKAALWRSFGIIKDLVRDGVSLYHGLSHELPFAIQHTRIKSVVTIHDLIFLKYPSHYNFFDRIIYKFKSRAACANANRIVAISERTKKDIIEFYNIDPEKIEVIYQSCDDAFKQPFSEERLLQISRKYNLPEKYILNVGTVESRKNLVALIHALKDIDPAYQLIVIGRKTDYYKVVAAALKKHGLHKRVVFFENMDFADLPGIYQKAALFVLPSYYEGFGIPVIEALYSGIPVIAASGSCLEEAGGPDSIYIAPDDIDALTAAINKVLQHPLFAAEMAAKGRSYVQRFENEALSKQMMDCYLKVLAT